MTPAQEANINALDDAWWRLRNASEIMQILARRETADQERMDASNIAFLSEQMIQDAAKIEHALELIRGAA